MEISRSLPSLRVGGDRESYLKHAAPPYLSSPRRSFCELGTLQRRCENPAEGGYAAA